MQIPFGGLRQSPEELTRQIGLNALSEAVSASAQRLYPDDPKAAAMMVVNTLQPYLGAFAPTVGSQAVTGTANTPHLSKTAESMVLGAVTGTKSHEVAKYQHSFPRFPGESCRDEPEK